MKKEKEPINPDKSRRVKFKGLTKNESFVLPVEVSRQEAQKVLDESELFNPYLLDVWKNKNLEND